MTAAPSSRCLFALPLLVLAVADPQALAQIAIATSYTQNFDSLGTALPSGWGVWTSSTATGNGTAFTWSTAQVANNASFEVGGAFRNLPGASQTWSTGLTTGTDRALGWRGDNAAARDGSLTFTLNDSNGYNFNQLSFNAFTPNSSGLTATFDFQYQIGTTGTFTPFSPSISYTTVSTAGSPPLTVTTISLTALDLAVLNNRSSPITFRFNHTGTSGTAWNTLAVDNFSYAASAVPEPSTYAAIFGATALAAAAWRRRR